MARFKPDPHLIAALGKDPSLLAALEEVGNKIADRARSLAPVEEGEYRSSLEVEIRHNRQGSPTARVSANDDKAAYIEWGTGHPGPTPAFAPLRRALRETVVVQRGVRVGTRKRAPKTRRKTT